MQALEEGRRRAALEQQSSERAIAMDKQHLEVRSQVLSLREGELESRLREREREKSTLEEQLKSLTLQLRREQVTRDVQAQRIQELENQLGQCRRQIATMIAGAIVRRRARQHRQPAAALSGEHLIVGGVRRTSVGSPHGGHRSS